MFLRNVSVALCLALFMAGTASGTNTRARRHLSKGSSSKSPGIPSTSKSSKSKGSKSGAKNYTELIKTILENKCYEVAFDGQRGLDCRRMDGIVTLTIPLGIGPDPFADPGYEEFFHCCDPSLIDFEQLAESCTLINGGPRQGKPGVSEPNCVDNVFTGGSGIAIVLQGALAPGGARTLCCDSGIGPFGPESPL